MEQQEMINIAKRAIRKGWDFEMLKYSDDLYGKEALADEVFEFVIECRKIGEDAFAAKYGA